jgi:DNA polymerase-1
MIKCANALKGYKTKIVLQIHDELIFKVPKEELDIVTPLLKKCMDEAMNLSIPLEVDGNAALTWYEAH